MIITSKTGALSSSSTTTFQKQGDLHPRCWNILQPIQQNQLDRGQHMYKLEIWPQYVHFNDWDNDLFGSDWFDKTWVSLSPQVNVRRIMWRVLCHEWGQVQQSAAFSCLALTLTLPCRGTTSTLCCDNWGQYCAALLSNIPHGTVTFSGVCQFSCSLKFWSFWN